jgi:hypothetical protein
VRLPIWRELPSSVSSSSSNSTTDSWHRLSEHRTKTSIPVLHGQDGDFLLYS